MKDLWERLKRCITDQDTIDQLRREHEQRMEWRREDIERARKQARAELRDEFAKAALIGLLAMGERESHRAYYREELADEAWAQADAMLKMRDAGKDEK